jgi:hypothetical protein
VAKKKQPSEAIAQAAMPLNAAHLFADMEFQAADDKTKQLISAKRFAVAFDHHKAAMLDGIKGVPRVDDTKAVLRAAITLLGFHLGHDTDIDIAASLQMVANIATSNRAMNQEMRGKNQ